jgi:ABC-2 type transport system permease protein
MASMTAHAEERSASRLSDVSSRPNALQRVANVWRYRELLVSLVRKELKVKYKNSVLGFVWSLLNPALYLVVFYIVFKYFLGAGLPLFAIFLLAGLLPWNLFGVALGAATGSIVQNPSLVTKVWFPREILPLASIGAGLVHFMLQTIVLFGALLIFRHAPSPTFLAITPVAMLALVLFLAAMSVGLAAINVYARDTQHLLELVLLAWFWMTPIVYQYMLVAQKTIGGVSVGNKLLLNPLTPVVITFQRAIYNKVDVVTKPNGVPTVTHVLPPNGIWWYLGALGILIGVSLVLLFGAFHIFGRLEDNFAEEI